MLALGKLVQHQDGMKVGAVGLGGAVHPPTYGQDKLLFRAAAATVRSLSSPGDLALMVPSYDTDSVLGPDPMLRTDGRQNWPTLITLL